MDDQAGAHLGAKGPDAHGAIPFQLGSSVGDRLDAFARRLLPSSLGGYKRKQVVEFLKAPNRQPLLILWGGARPHRSRLVREYVESTNDQIDNHFLPPCALELNPVEYRRAWLKCHALANFCPDTMHKLNQMARAKLKSGQSRSAIIDSCWAQAELF